MANTIETFVDWDTVLHPVPSSLTLFLLDIIKPIYYPLTYLSITSSIEKYLQHEFEVNLILKKNIYYAT